MFHIYDLITQLVITFIQNNVIILFALREMFIYSSVFR